ncbi:hypothetical protein BGZ60DRAFT_35275 [Tricladium varicosporioides]|nr:hypothetical protein BGZ60DRAFT_35275 [Hymenoscyphus varicosporioides]
MSTLKWDQCELAQLQPGLNNTVSSPVAGENLIRGFWDSNHLSAASIHYTQATLPTPWPVLLAGLLMSLGSAIKILISNSKKPTMVSIAINTAFSSLQVVRCVLAFLGACIAIKSHEGRFRPPSAIVVLLLSTIPYSLERRSFRISRVFAGIGILFAIITLSMMVAIRAKDSNDYYGKWVLDFSGNVTGYSNTGNCPFVVGQDDDPRNTCPDPYYVGCGLNLIPDDIYKTNKTLWQSKISGQNPNTYHVRNKLALGETILGLILLIPGIGGGFFILIPLGFVLMGSYIVWAVKFLRRPFAVDPLDPNDELERYKKNTAKISTIAILIFIAVSFPLHYLQQTRPTGFMVLDSFGPLEQAEYQTTDVWGVQKPMLDSWTGNSRNGTSWSDFFYVETPTDDWGFVNHWWIENRNRVENWLPIL